MRAIPVTLICFAIVGAAYAQSPANTPRDPSCNAEATTKNLAGAAKTSFLKKCETDSTTACDIAAADKKLSGAAKKCIADSVGS